MSSVLKEFFNSLDIQDLKNKDNEIRRLKTLLDDEQNEKADLIEKLQSLEQTNKKTQLLLNEKIKENKSLKEDLNQSINGSSDLVSHENKEKVLLKEVQELKNELNGMKLENANEASQICELEKMKKYLEQLLARQTKIEEINGCCKDLQEQLSSANSDLQLSQEENEKLSEKNSDLDTELTNTKIQITKSNEEVANSLREITELNNKISCDEVKLSEFKTLVQTMEQEKTNWQTSLQSQQCMYEAKFNKLIEVIQKTKLYLSKLEEDCSKLRIAGHPLAQN